MMESGTVHPEDFLSEAAFLLLSSSSVHRYVRMAQSLAASSPLRADLKSNRVTVQQVLRYAQKLWGGALGQKQRGLEEIELAVILAILQESSIEAVDELLIRMSVIDRPPVSWISALARRLYQERASNQEIRIAQSVSLYFLREHETTFWTDLGIGKRGAFISYKDTGSHNTPETVSIAA